MTMQAQQFQESLFTYLQAQGWNLKKAKLLTGGGATNKNKKMHFYNYDLSAWDCNKGSQLRKVKNSVCSSCYAMKGNYLRYREGSVGKSHKLHKESLNNGFQWVLGMVYQVLKSDCKYFRFHAAGDLQSYEHALQIINLARLTPSCKYWIPTRETSILKQLKDNKIYIPKNCIFRVSAPLIDAQLNSKVFSYTSSVITNKKLAKNSKICPSIKQGGQCLDCRGCWSDKVNNIAYLIH